MAKLTDWITDLTKEIKKWKKGEKGKVKTIRERTDELLRQLQGMWGEKEMILAEVKDSGRLVPMIEKRLMADLSGGEILPKLLTQILEIL